MKKGIIISIVLMVLFAFYSGCIEDNKSKTTEKTNSEIALEFITEIQHENLDVAYTYFSQLMKSQFSLNQFQTTWDTITSLYGNFESIKDTSESVEDGYDIVFVNCTFSNGYYIIFKIVFYDSKEIEGFWTERIDTIISYTKPDYVNTSSFSEYEITIGTDPWELPGTISIPNGDGLFPCIILVHGSGPNDRDETIGPNKPFKDIAWGLASNGIAVLRYDKRTKIYSNEIASDLNFTVKEEVINDALAAFDFLRNYEKIDSKNISVLGHSLGAMMAPKIASIQQNISKIIMLAPPARPLEDLIYNQTIYLAEVDGIIDENESIAIKEIEDAIEKIKTLNFSEDEQVLNAYKAYWEYLKNYDQVEVAKALDLPIFILQGKRDYQVTYEDDFFIWNSSISNKSNVLLKAYTNLNHLFMPSNETSIYTEYFEEDHVVVEVINDIIDFIIQK